MSVQGVKNIGDSAAMLTGWTFIWDYFIGHLGLIQSIVGLIVGVLTAIYTAIRIYQAIRK